MASADVKKHKSATEVKAGIRHDNQESRLKDEHSNPHIDKSKTSGNMGYLINHDGSERTYAQDCERYDMLIKHLDLHPKANKRKDRVTEVCFEVPCPEGMNPSDEKNFFIRVGDILCEQFNKNNLIQGYFHQDEKHEYYDPQEKRMRTSLNHMTYRFVPGVDGKLNAKEFTKRSELIKMNKNLETLCQMEFNCKFNNGKGKRGKSVEQLKAETALAEKDLMIKQAQKNAELILKRANEEADEILEKAETDAQMLSESKIRRAEREAKEILDEAKKMQSEASESLREINSARGAYEQAERAVRNYLDSMKDEPSLTDWAQRKVLSSGKTIYSLYRNDTVVKRKNKEYTKNIAEQQKQRLRKLESRFGHILDKTDEFDGMEHY